MFQQEFYTFIAYEQSQHLFEVLQSSSRTKLKHLCIKDNREIIFFTVLKSNSIQELYLIRDLRKDIYGRILK
ncbi:hypothetical protein pb186bvf_020504 [Paramecium bursaria]